MSDSRYQKLNESDEIDLVELVKNLWKKKLWIILSAFVCTAIAAGYAFTAKEQWTSKSVVIAPKVANLGDYLSFRPNGIPPPSRSLLFIYSMVYLLI